MLRGWRLLPFLLAAGLTGCGYPQAKRQLEASRAETAQLRQTIGNLPQDVAAKDQAAWDQHERDVAALPAQLQKELEDSLKKALARRAAEQAEVLNAFRATLAQLRQNVQTSTQQLLDQHATVHQNSLTEARTELAQLRQQIDALVKQVGDARTTDGDAQVQKAHEALDAGAKDLAERLTSLVELNAEAGRLRQDGQTAAQQLVAESGKPHQDALAELRRELPAVRQQMDALVQQAKAARAAAADAEVQKAHDALAATAKALTDRLATMERAVAKLQP
jgi:ElaB/YqjD/DUF883 family membrane-anchored ribosome-binding protein